MSADSFDAQMAKLRATFLARLATTRAALEGLVAEADIDRLVDIGHRLKGSAGSYGLAELGEVAAATETSLSDADATQVPELAAPLIAAVDAALSRA